MDMLNAVKNVLAGVSSVSPLSEQLRGYTLIHTPSIARTKGKTSANTFFTTFNQYIHIHLSLIQSMLHRYTNAELPTQESMS